MQDTDHPGPHSIPCQDIKTVVPIQLIIVLVQVEEYGIEYFLSHGDELLNQLCLEGGVLHSFPCAKSI